MTQKLKIYFAGDLFDHKHLLGNHILATYLNKTGNGRYKVIFPQIVEHAESRSVDIRNKDLEMLISSDVAIFNFDGPDLDSGTVVEFVFAKMLDIPSVLVRTDFRIAGDQGGNGDPWNLMCSGYPRTESLSLNAMAEYHSMLTQTDETDNLPELKIAALYEKIAAQIINKLDKAVASSSLFAGCTNTAVEMYSRVIAGCGSDLDKVIPVNTIKNIVHEKVNKGLI